MASNWPHTAFVEQALAKAVNACLDQHGGSYADVRYLSD